MVVMVRGGGSFMKKETFCSVSLEEFLEDEQELLNTVTALTTEIQQRDEKIGDINSRLQNKLEGLDSLLVRISELDDHSKTD